MSTREVARRALYARLAEVLGDQHAETLMTYLPSVETPHLATRDDVAALGRRIEGLDRRMERFEEQLVRFEDRLYAMSRTYVATTVGAMVALAGAVIAGQAMF